MLSEAEYTEGSLSEYILFSILCKQKLCKKSFFFFFNNLLHYLKIFLYKEDYQKFVICVLPFIFLNLVFLTELCIFFLIELNLHYLLCLLQDLRSVSLPLNIFYFTSSAAEYFCHS